MPQLPKAFTQPAPALDFEPPESWPLPGIASVAKNRLAVVPSGEPAPSPHPGCWRSLTELDGSTAQFLAVARRYGPLTLQGPLTMEGTAAEEPIQLWRELCGSLRPLAAAWDATGRIAEPPSVVRARAAALDRHAADLRRHIEKNGVFAARGFGVVLLCQDLRSFWLRSAIADVAELPEMKRCRWCGVWLSSRESRRDSGFCVPAHRSAFHQKRAPKSTFWAEA